MTDEESEEFEVAMHEQREDSDSTYAGKYVQPTRGPLGRAYERVRRFVVSDEKADNHR